MQNSITEIFQIIEKAIYFAQVDAYYILPVISSIQIFFIGVFFKKPKLIYFSLFLFVLFCSIFPLVKLIPNLGSDAFSEFQKLNLNEAYFYIKTLNFFAGWSVKHFILWFLIIFTYALFIFIIYQLSKKIHFLNFLNINYVIVITLILVPTTLNFYKVSLLYSSSIIEKENQSKNINYQLDTIDIKLNEPTDISVVFYIGESTSRLHWSIYKYFRPTNKKLQKFNEVSPLILYDNIYSTHTHTSPSLLDTLTIKANHSDKDVLKLTSESPKYSIVDILNNVSIDTTLFSTQAKSGSWNLASSLIFKNANKKFYSSKYNLGNASYIDSNRLYDHEFLNEFTNSIKNDSKKKNFYVFHSYAGHGNYKKNIPNKYRKNIDSFYSNYNNRAIFGKDFKNNQKKFLESYDSAMNYVSDNIVFSLEKISKLDKPIIFIYTSDHGESPLTGRAHDSSRYIWEMSSVPFLIYFNDEAKLRYPELYAKFNLRASKKNRDLLSNFPSLIFEIFGIKIFNKNSKLNNTSKCKFGDGNCFEDYHIIRNQLKTLGVVNLNYPTKINNYVDNTDRATTFSNMKHYLSNKNYDLEICSHRTNSIARFVRFNAILNCMEIDVIIESNHLDVRHSSEISTSLKLNDLIKVQKGKDNILWLDIKEIKNIEQCNQLANILKNFYLKNNKINFFIEFPSKVLNEISLYKECILNIKSMNFPISYYVPNDVKSKCLKEGELDNSSSNNCQYLENLINKIYKSNLFTDLSFDYKNYVFLKNNKYIDKFILNTWHIPDEKIISIKDKNFRLAIPFNDAINYN
jgi:glucan phosphoethanolaminetransferase (alkaline phosphatase superfamily)